MDYLISLFNSFHLGSDITSVNLKLNIKRNFRYLPGSETIVICLPGWGGKLDKWKIIEKYTLSSGASFLAYEFPRGIFSDQKELTKKLFGEINTIVRNEIKNLKIKYRFKKCILICISLASSYGSLVYKSNPDINEIILVAPGENLAKDMWYGYRTQHFRKSFERQKITETQLMEDWHNLASKNNFPASGTRVKMFFGKSDKIIPYKFSHELAEVYRQHNLEITKRTFLLGHYFLISLFLFFPKRFLGRCFRI